MWKHSFFLWIVHSVYGTTFPYPDYTISTPRALDSEQLSCLQNVTKFVQREGLCDSPDDVLPRGQDLKSCANRCGASRNYGSFLQCACDEKCVIYEDCCKDMFKECPELHARGKYEMCNLAGADVSCAGTSILINERRKFGATQPSFTFLEETTEEAATVTDGLLSKENLSLLDIMKDINVFIVADVEHGILFNDLRSFSSWKCSSSKMAAVPQVVTLGCNRKYIGALENRNLLKILRFCVGASMLPVPSVFHRSCKYESAISCTCGRSTMVLGHLRHACYFTNEPTSRFLFTHRFGGKRADHDLCDLNGAAIRSRGPENIVQVEDLDINMPWSGTIGKNQIAVTLTVSPLVDSIDDKDIPDHTLEFPTMTLYDVPLKYVVDVQENLEKRLRCPNFAGLLSECILDQCAKGAVLVSRPLSPWAFGGHVCVFPISAVVEGSDAGSEVGVCNCLKMINALNSLNVWKVKLRESWRGKCVLQLKTLPQESEPPMGIYNFSTLHLTKPSVRRFLGPLSLQDFTQGLLDQMDKTKETCLDEMLGDIQICFYSSTFDASKEEELILCVPFYSASSAAHIINQRGVFALVVVWTIVRFLSRNIREAY